MMLIHRKRIPAGNGSAIGLAVALVFVLLAGFTAIAHGATRSVEGLDFDRVVVRDGAEVEITQKDGPRLRMRGEKKYLDREPFYLRGDTLYLGGTRGGRTVPGVKFKVAVRELESLKVTGAADVYLKPLRLPGISILVRGSGQVMIHELVADEADLSVVGSGVIQLARAEIKRLDMVVSGSGDIELGEVSGERVGASLNGSGSIAVAEEGAAAAVQVNVVGSGDIELGRVRARTAEVNIMGSGDAEVWAERELEIGIVGSGDVKYFGEPDVNSSVLGSGDVERAE